MVTILSRSRWTSTSARGSAINWGRVRGIVCHYPAMGKSVGVLTQSQEAARLRGWRSYHVNSLGWKDIGYSYAVAQSGRIYSLRGDRVGGHTYGHNSTTLGVLFIVGDNEPLTVAAKASFRALRATLRKRGASSGVWGHTEMSGNSTRCPGPYIMGSIRNGTLKGGPSIPTGGTSVGGSRPSSSNVWDTSPRIRGMSKSEVVSVQKLLVGAGYSVGSYGVDGSYKGDTVSAVRKAQKALGVTVDGIAGPDTIKALKAAQKPTQEPASKPTRKVKVDGRYGRKTHSEVQRRRGRPVDGRLGKGDLADLCEFFGLPRYDEISDQPRRHDEIGNAIVPGIWDHDPDHKGPNSIFVRTWEAYAGADVDRGSWGPELSSRIQVMLNEHDGFMRDRDAVQVGRRAKRAGVR